MDLNRQLASIGIGGDEIAEIPSNIRVLPRSELQVQIDRVCHADMHYDHFFSAVAKLAASGIPHSELYKELAHFEQYASPSSGTINNSGVIKAIKDHEKAYAHQVGTRPMKSIPGDCFPVDVYDNLPKQIKEICFLVDDSRKRDVCLVGIITALSSAFSRYRFYHGSGTDVKEYSPHLLSLVIGSAGSGKGLTRYGVTLVDEITRAAIEMRKRAMEQYRLAKSDYERDRKKREKEGSSMVDLPEPVKPKKYAFAMSASDTTQAALVEILYENPIGGFAYDSEVDTMVQGNAKKDFGGFSDVVRKVFHHEPLARQRKGDGESYIVNEPRLAVMLSGTHDQLRKLIHSEYNGLFSRLWFYSIPSVFQPYTMATHSADVVGNACRQLQPYIFQAADLWSDELIYMEFSTDQELELFNAMQDKEQIEKKYGGDVGASWLRMAIIIKRIAVTLAGFQGAVAGIVPDNCWTAAISLLPAIKAHSISALNCIRENQGKIPVSKEEYDTLRAEGKTDQEIAEVLSVSVRTLQRRKSEDWN